MSSKNISYFLIDGIPNGRIKCTIAGWTGVAYKIPRISLENSKEIPYLSQSGIYFLFGKSDEADEKVVYVGQADVRKNGNGLLGRLIEHKRNPDKDYWTEAVVVTTKDDWLGATEISWLESYFCTLAKNAKRYVVKNGNEPSPGKPKEEVISDLEDFVDIAKTVIGVLGHDVFVPLVSKGASDNVGNDELLYCTASGTDAKGQRTSDGFVIFAGSKARLEISKHCREYVKHLREKNISELDTDGILLHDILFDSPSGASSFLVGQSTNGLTTWKTANGRTLKEIEASEE
jgi:hypothetical protein